MATIVKFCVYHRKDSVDEKIGERMRTAEDEVQDPPYLGFIRNATWLEKKYLRREVKRMASNFKSKKHGATTGQS